MQFSKFGEKFTKNSGILQLMDDLGNALNSEQPINMLGGAIQHGLIKLTKPIGRCLKPSLKVIWAQWPSKISGTTQRRRAMPSLLQHW